MARLLLVVGLLLLVLGLVWAAIGVANIVMMAWQMDPHQMIGLIFHLVVFVVPGLAFAGIGSAIAKRNRDRGSEEPAAGPGDQ
jgi:hypothetical protein